MPRAAPVICTYPGCNTLTVGSRCDQHQAQQQEQRRAWGREHDKRRGHSAQRGYDRRWQKLRGMVLSRDPICTGCGLGISTDVDHIVPKRAGGPDTMGNLQGLCHSCHSKKTAGERRGRQGGPV